MTEFNNGDVFIVMGQHTNASRSNPPPQEPQFPAIGTIPSIPPIQSTPARRRSALCTVKVIKADLDQSTGKPTNALRYNLQIHVPIYSEVEATVEYILQHVKSHLVTNDIVLVHANGLQYRDDEGTRGKDIKLYRKSSF